MVGSKFSNQAELRPLTNLKVTSILFCEASIFTEELQLLSKRIRLTLMGARSLRNHRNLQKLISVLDTDHQFHVMA